MSKENSDRAMLKASTAAALRLEREQIRVHFQAFVSVPEIKALISEAQLAAFQKMDHRRIAFRVNADEFAQFIQDSVGWSDPPLGRESIRDHARAISVSFEDPFGNLLEVTTYDYKNAEAFVNSLPNAIVTDS
jgi:hypothetical protein